jgi:hypothetical protein
LKSEPFTQKFGHALQAQLAHQALHCAAGNRQALSVHLLPDFDDAINLPIGVPHPLNMTATFFI